MNEYPTTPDNLDDVVFVVHWRRNATEIVGDKTYFADVYGSLAVPAPDPADFTPYEDLTFPQVCGWLEAGLDTVALDEGLANQIANQINPPIISLPLPWMTTTSSTTTTTTLEG